MMNTSNVFQFKKSGRVFSFSTVVLLGIFFGGQLSGWPDFDGLSDRLAVGDYPSIWGILGFLLLAILVFLELWLFLNMGLFTVFYKITLTDSAIEIRSRDFFLRKFLNNLYNNNVYFLGNIPYESIKSIDADWRPSTGKIILENGATVLLGIRSLEYYGEFIRQLTEHLEKSQMGDGLQKLTQPKRYATLQMAIYTIAFLPTVVLLMGPVFERYQDQVFQKELSSFGAQSISADTDGSIWAGTYSLNGNSYIWHLSETIREHWTLSEETCSDCLSFLVSHDGLNHPVVVDHLLESADVEKRARVYAWNGKEWEQYIIEGDFYQSQETSMVGTKIWGTQGDTLVQVDFSTGERREFPFPDLASLSQLRLLSMTTNSDGSILARFTDKNQPEYLYRFSGGDWQQETPVLFVSEKETIFTFCQDTQGNIWVVTFDFDKTWRIGYYDHAKSFWNWHDFQPGEPDRSISLLHDIAVDSYGRVWVSGTYEQQTKSNRFINFVSVFQRNDEQLQLLEEYTDENSNIDYVKQIVTTENRVWIKGRELYWVDTRTEELPSPAPALAVWIGDGLYENFGLFFMLLAGQLVLFLIGVSLEYK